METNQNKHVKKWDKMAMQAEGEIKKKKKKVNRNKKTK